MLEPANEALNWLALLRGQSPESFFHDPGFPRLGQGAEFLQKLGLSHAKNKAQISSKVNLRRAGSRAAKSNNVKA
jgi:hypothetical protein